MSILNLDETLDNLFYNLTSIQYVYVLLRLNKTNKWTQQTANLHTHTLQFIVWIHTYIKERKQRVNFNLRSMLILILKKNHFYFLLCFLEIWTKNANRKFEKEKNRKIIMKKDEKIYRYIYTKKCELYIYIYMKERKNWNTLNYKTKKIVHFYLNECIARSLACRSLENGKLFDGFIWLTNFLLFYIFI